jgi:hypothetical protein
MREAGVDMEVVTDRAKGVTEAVVGTPAEAVARVRLVIRVGGMVICLATAPKAKNVITVSPSGSLAQVKK